MTHDIIERMMFLVLQLGVIIFCARLGAMLFEKLRLPSIVGEIAAGMVIGPYLLGGITLPVLGMPLFPIYGNFPVSIELYGFTTVASIVLLFLVGLETDLEMFLKYSITGSLVGIGGVIVSFILGDLVAVFFLSHLTGTEYSFMHPMCLFFGVVSTATSVGITARLLSENRKMQSPEGVTIISAAVIDDILGVIALAIVIAIAKSGHVEWRQITRIAVKSLGIWLGFTAAGFFLAQKISKLLKKFKDTTTITIMSFGLALILAGIFEKAGLAMIIGAYVMGLSLSRTDLDYVIQDKLSSLHRFFVPIFFCVIGMMVDLSGVFSKSVLLFGLVYTGANIFGKVLGCGLPALLLNFNARGALRIGMGMTPRGEVTLLMAGIGLSAGIIGQDTLGVIVMMTMLTALITPAIFSASLKSDLPATRKERPKKDVEKQIIFDMPTPETAELLLGKIVLAFSNEGFFVHRLDASERFSRLYQIRKDQTFIGMRASSSDIEFDCKEEDMVFINTLVYEVLAELENTMKQLQSSVDKRTIGKKIFDKSNGRKIRKKSFVSQISPNAVEIKLKSDTKDGIIEEMLDILVRSGQLDEKSKKSVLQNIKEREDIMSTGMQDGIALPHAKCTCIKKMLSAVGVKKDGVDFGSLDGKSSSIFVMILSPKDSTGPHIRFMADISQVLMDESKRKEILECKTNAQLYKLLVS